MAKHGYCDYIFKLLFVGDSSVGKSCLIVKYCDNVFQESFISTVGIDFKIKTIELYGKKVKLQIWDTAGQERFQTITASYFRSANAIFLTYDVTCVNTFNHVANWLRQIQANAPEDVCKMLIGNKCDKTELRQVTTERGKRLAAEFNMLFCETSAKTGENVEKAFLDVAMVLLNKQTAAMSGINQPTPRKGSATQPVKLNRTGTNGKTDSRKVSTRCC